MGLCPLGFHRAVSLATPILVLSLPRIVTIVCATLDTDSKHVGHRGESISHSRCGKSRCTGHYLKDTGICTPSGWYRKRGGSPTLDVGHRLGLEVPHPRQRRGT